MATSSFSPGKKGQTSLNSGREEPAALSRVVEREENFASVIAVVVVIDTSGSVASHGPAIVSGLMDTIAYLKKDVEAAAMVELATVEIASPVKVTGLQPVGQFQPPVLEFGSASPIWEAHGKALDLFSERMRRCREVGRPFQKGILLSMTDWQATDQPEGVPNRLKAAENDETLLLNFFPVVVGDEPNLELANRVSSERQAAVLKDLNYKGMFRWFSQAVTRHVKTRLGEAVIHPSTDDWTRGK